MATRESDTSRATHPHFEAALEALGLKQGSHVRGGRAERAVEEITHFGLAKPNTAFPKHLSQRTPSASVPENLRFAGKNGRAQGAAASKEGVRWTRYDYDGRKHPGPWACSDNAATRISRAVKRMTPAERRDTWISEVVDTDPGLTRLPRLVDGLDLVCTIEEATAVAAEQAAE